MKKLVTLFGHAPSVRLRDTCLNYGIETPEALKAFYDSGRLARARGVGDLTLQHARELLADLGLSESS